MPVKTRPVRKSQTRETAAPAGASLLGPSSCKSSAACIRIQFQGLTVVQRILGNFRIPRLWSMAELQPLRRTGLGSPAAWRYNPRCTLHPQGLGPSGAGTGPGR
ncbi:hypothetical protein FH972_022004 [Carpinus fangiana]|uniref:Uncharacterized protein n=1 Tax=Carpinus fangiana TaxID=176857 RepID=A0A5N6KRC0_9ROSI|nr:hypothetical protein FH972_022004 [Carpinus fangiana]